MNWLKRKIGMGDDDGERQREAWCASQLKDLGEGREIQPPWVAFDGSSPVFGWNQGWQEHWKKNVWSPFWQGLGPAEKASYLEQWPAPNAEWVETISNYWLEK